MAFISTLLLGNLLLSTTMGTKKAGYLDDVFNVLDASKHPCIIIGRFALKWMGCGVFSEEVTVSLLTLH